VHRRPVRGVCSPHACGREEGRATAPSVNVVVDLCLQKIKQWSGAHYSSPAPPLDPAVIPRPHGTHVLMVCLPPFFLQGNEWCFFLALRTGTRNFPPQKYQ